MYRYLALLIFSCVPAWSYSATILCVNPVTTGNPCGNASATYSSIAAAATAMFAITSTGNFTATMTIEIACHDGYNTLPCTTAWTGGTVFSMGTAGHFSPTATNRFIITGWPQYPVGSGNQPIVDGGSGDNCQNNTAHTDVEYFRFQNCSEGLDFQNAFAGFTDASSYFNEVTKTSGTCTYPFGFTINGTTGWNANFKANWAHGCVNGLSCPSGTTVINNEIGPLTGTTSVLGAGSGCVCNNNILWGSPTSGTGAFGFCSYSVSYDNNYCLQAQDGAADTPILLFNIAAGCNYNAETEQLSSVASSGIFEQNTTYGGVNLEHGIYGGSTDTFSGEISVATLTYDIKTPQNAGSVSGITSNYNDWWFVNPGIIGWLNTPISPNTVAQWRTSSGLSETGTVATNPKFLGNPAYLSGLSSQITCSYCQDIPSRLFFIRRIFTPTNIGVKNAAICTSVLVTAIGCVLNNPLDMGATPVNIFNNIGLGQSQGIN